MLKNVLHIFQCHFRSKKMPKHSRKPESNKNQQPPQEENEKKIQACRDAAENLFEGHRPFNLMSSMSCSSKEE